MTQSDQVVHSIELPESIIGLRRDGIVHVYYKPHTEISSEYQGRQLAAFNETGKGKKFAVIYEAGENVTAGTEVRANGARLEGVMPTLCKVVYVQTLAHQLIAEFYYKFNKPKQPYKVFKDFDEGIQWLLETKKQLDAKP